MNILSSVLKILDIPFTWDYLAKTFWTHPERGNLLAYTKILSHYGVSTKTIKVSSIASLRKEHLPCISLYKEQFVVINQLSSSNVVLTTNGTTLTTIDQRQFSSSWNHIVTFFQKTQYSNEPFYTRNRNSLYRKVGGQALSIVVGLLLLLATPSTHSLYFLVNLISLCLGLYLSIYLSKQTLSQPVTSFYQCPEGDLFDCSTFSRPTRKIDLSRLGIVYFASALTFLCVFYEWTLALPVYISLGALFSLYPLYLQARVYRKWCIFCIVIQLNVVLLATFDIWHTWTHSALFTPFPSRLFLFAFAIIIFWAWIVEGLYNQLRHREQSLVDHISRLGLFKLRLLNEVINPQDQMRCRTSQVAPKHISIGANDSPNNLIIVLNPFCYSCGVEYMEAYNSLNTCTSLQTNIVLVCTNEDQKEFAQSIFTQSNDSNQASHILYEWFSRGGGLQEFSTAHGENPTNKLYIESAIKSHREWVSENEITETPTYFLNGIKVPSGITISEILNYV